MLRLFPHLLMFNHPFPFNYDIIQLFHLFSLQLCNRPMDLTTGPQSEVVKGGVIKNLSVSLENASEVTMRWGRVGSCGVNGRGATLSSQKQQWMTCH